MWLKKMQLIAALATVGTLVLAGCDDDDDPGGPQGPGAPSNVELSVTGTSITVGWAAGSGADSHRVELTAEDEDTREEAVGGSATSVTFDDLTPGVLYSGQVFAVSAGDEAASSVVAAAGPIEESSVVLVSESIVEDETWTSNNIYVLQGAIFVGEDVGIDGTQGTSVALTIEPGTTILGATEAGTRASVLVVSRGSQIIADANANRSEADQSSPPDPDDVIVFTSDAPRGQRTRGQWGGLVINGRAPTNTGQEAEGEGNSGLYGGPDEMDSSGILRGVRVEFAGDDVTAADQLNGIAFQGVGAGTTVDYVQVHHNSDDGTEPFGGAVSQTHMVMTGIRDDSFDGTDGYKGFIQFAIAQQLGDEADRGFEFSNNGDNEDATPVSTPVVANVTLVGGREGVVAAGVDEGGIGGPGSSIGVNLREGAAFRVYNTIVTGFGESGFDIEGSGTAARADGRLGGDDNPESTLSFANNILWSNGAEGDSDDNFADASDDGYNQDENKVFFEAFDNMLADPQLPESAFELGTMESPPDFIPAAMPEGYSAFDVSALNGGAGLVMPADNRVLEQTDYAGAVEPGTALEDAWYVGWTVWSRDGSDSRPNQDGN